MAAWKGVNIERGDQMNLKTLEANSWAQRVDNHYDNISKIEGGRAVIFELMGIPNHHLENLIFTKKMVEVRGRLITIETLRPFHTLPKWLKKRMKFRLNNRRIANYPELKSFVENLVN